MTKAEELLIHLCAIWETYQNGYLSLDEFKQSMFSFRRQVDTLNIDLYKEKCP